MRPTIPLSQTPAVPLRRRRVDFAQPAGSRAFAQVPPVGPQKAQQRDVELDDEAERPPATWGQLTMVAFRLVVWPFLQMVQGFRVLAAEVARAWRTAARDVDLDAPSSRSETPPVSPAASPSPPSARPPTPAPSNQATAQTASSPVPPPPVKSAATEKAGDNTLTLLNETAAQKAENRRRYIASMGRLGTWGGEYELIVLAEQWNVRVQVFSPGVEKNAGTYVCSAVRGVPGAEKIINLHYDQRHYRALMHLAGGRRVEAEAVRRKKDYRDVNVPGEGDCLFVAFAYAANVAHTRRLVDHLATPARRADSGLRTDAALAQQLDVDPTAYSDDTTFATAALDALTMKLRRRLVRELSRPRHTENLDLCVVHQLADT